MGLDIYFHKTTLRFNGDADNSEDFKAFTKEVDAKAQSDLKEFIDKNIKPLEEADRKMKTNSYWENIYGDEYFKFVEKLRKVICRNYDHKIYPFTKSVLPLDELKKALANEVEMWWEQYDAYFRKVNFIFNFYENTLGTMKEQWYALTTAEDIDDLIYRCERVLKDHSKAPELLPTQSGFFFGSTDYEDWYFEDVKYCLKQMKKFRKGLTDDMTAYVIFSW